MSFFSAAPDGDDWAKMNADKAQTDTFKQAGAAYSNKRQSDRDFYGNALANRAASYQGAMNMLGASGGGAPNMAGLDRGNNPLTLQGTGIGSTQGSNYTGWQTPGSDGKRHGQTYGIKDYIYGTDQKPLGHSEGDKNNSWSDYGQAYQLPSHDTRDGTGGSVRIPPEQQHPQLPPRGNGYSFNFGGKN